MVNLILVSFCRTGMSTGLFGKTTEAVRRLNGRNKKRYVAIEILCDLAPPRVSECNTTVENINPRSVTICQT